FLDNRSSSCFFSSSNSATERRITGLNGGSAVGSVSIRIASPLSGGRPEGRVAGNTSGNSVWTIVWISGGRGGRGNGGLESVPGLSEADSLLSSSGDRTKAR